MAQRTVINSLSGAVLSISASLPATYDASGYGATTLVFTACGQVESFGNHGVTATVTEFTPIDTAVIAKVKGSKNYGTMSTTFADLPSDAGQVLMKTASESNAHYSLKITYQDTSIHYLDVLVAKAEYQNSSVNDVLKFAVDFAVCRAPTIVAQV